MIKLIYYQNIFKTNIINNKRYIYYFKNYQFSKDTTYNDSILKLKELSESLTNKKKSTNEQQIISNTKFNSKFDLNNVDIEEANSNLSNKLIEHSFSSIQEMNQFLKNIEINKKNNLYRENEKKENEKKENENENNNIVTDELKIVSNDPDEDILDESCLFDIKFKKIKNSDNIIDDNNKKTLKKYTILSPNEENTFINKYFNKRISKEDEQELSKDIEDKDENNLIGLINNYIDNTDSNNSIYNTKNDVNNIASNKVDIIDINNKIVEYNFNLEDYYNKQNNNIVKNNSNELTKEDNFSSNLLKRFDNVTFNKNIRNLNIKNIEESNEKIKDEVNSYIKSNEYVDNNVLNINEINKKDYLQYTSNEYKHNSEKDSHNININELNSLKDSKIIKNSKKANLKQKDINLVTDSEVFGRYNFSKILEDNNTKISNKKSISSKSVSLKNKNTLLAAANPDLTKSKKELTVNIKNTNIKEKLLFNNNNNYEPKIINKIKSTNKTYNNSKVFKFLNTNISNLNNLFTIFIENNKNILIQEDNSNTLEKKNLNLDKFLDAIGSKEKESKVSNSSKTSKYISKPIKNRYKFKPNYPKIFLDKFRINKLYSTIDIKLFNYPFMSITSKFIKDVIFNINNLNKILSDNSANSLIKEINTTNEDNKTYKRTVSLVYNTSKSTNTKSYIISFIVFFEDHEICKLIVNVPDFRTEINLLESFICLSLVKIIQSKVNDVFSYELVSARAYDIHNINTALNGKNYFNFIISNIINEQMLLFNKPKITSESEGGISIRKIKQMKSNDKDINNLNINKLNKNKLNKATNTNKNLSNEELKSKSLRYIYPNLRYFTKIKKFTRFFNQTKKVGEQLDLYYGVLKY